MRDRRGYVEGWSVQGGGWLRNLLKLAWSHVDNTVLLSLGPNQEAHAATLAHEYGHIADLKDDNEGTAEPGWCLDQSTGNSCGPKIYLVFKFNLAYRYQDIMSNIQPENTWISSNSYNNLYGKFID